MSLRFAVAACLAALVALGAAAGARAAAAAPRADEPLPGFDLGETLNGTFSAQGLGAVWISGEELARFTSGRIDVINAGSGSTKTLVASTVLTSRNRNVASWTISKDQTKLLWGYDVITGFRHSTEAKYSVLIIATGIWRDLHEGKHLQTAQLAPEGNGVAYVYENNIYYVGDITTSATAKAVTEDGSKYIYNGVPDWVYEEEVLSSGSAMWFSPNGRYLAYAKFDDTKVQEFSYIIYGQGQYSNVTTLLYPKPGTDNPTVVVFVNTLVNNNTVTLPPPSSTHEILQTMAWAGNEKVLVVWLNRIQNNVAVVSYNATETTAWTSKSEFTDNEPSGWLDVGTPRAVSDTAWVMLLPRKFSSGDDERFTRPTIFRNSVVSDIVSSKLTATALYGWNNVTGRIFFQAAPEGHPAQRHVYSINDQGTQDLRCLSCSLTEPYNGTTACLYASASFSTDLTHAAFTCSGPGPAAVRMATVRQDGGVNWPASYWQDNSQLLEKLSKRLMPTVIGNITVVVSGGITARAKLWLPPNMEKNKKYPMLVYVYGGPGSQQVSEAFSVNWGFHLTTTHNIIYASIDGRGSGFQGSKTLYALYKKLGTVEVEDQISVTASLVSQYDFIDPDRVGIWGWSYGGYATAMAMARDTNGVFACGASVAPVTSWDLYDSIYTERYMDVPQSNAAGYKAANVSDKIENFKRHQFYLLHGNADDNVHFQQAMRLARALEEKDVFFEQQSYPDENHSIRSVVTHVYMSLTVFFNRCFEPKSNSAVGLEALLPALVLPLLAHLLS